MTNKRKAYIANWEANHPEKRRSYRDKWAANNPGKTIASRAKWKANNPQAIAVMAKRYRSKYPQRERAGNAIVTELRAGRMIRQPCELCGEVKVDGHHDDYDKPLEVRWLCRVHHVQLHVAARTA